MSQTNNCDCACPTLTMLPVRGFGLAVDASSLGGQGVTPGPDNTHLVTRNGALVWEPFGQTDIGLMPPADLYVATDGDDANDGLTPENPFATIQAAVDSTRKYAVTDQQITIHVASGSYAEGVKMDAYSGHYLNLRIQGDEAGYPLIDGDVIQQFGGWLELAYLHVTSSGCCFRAHSYCRMTIADCLATVRNGGEAAYYATGSAQIDLSGTHTAKIDGSAGYFALLIMVGKITVNPGAKLDCKGTVTGATFWANHQSIMTVPTSAVLSGSVTGKKYSARSNSIITAPGHTIPGTVAGTTGNGGAYYG